MAALFPRWSNTAFRLALIGLVLLVITILAAPMVYVRTPYATDQFLEVDQPVEFDHRHHVRDDGIDCLYCHQSAEVSPSGGIPSTDVCMGCHAQIWNQSPLLEPVRRSYFTGLPIPWNRVHDLPDHVYFNHAIHVQRGIGCVVCHGRVDLMARVHKVAPLTMGWCLDCHRNPQEYLRAWSRTRDYQERTDYSSMWGATIDMFDLELPGDRRITYLTTCTACHR
jgi:hypothetical protein